MHGRIIPSQAFSDRASANARAFGRLTGLRSLLVIVPAVINELRKVNSSTAMFRRRQV